MGNNILKAIIEEKIKGFVNAFSDTSEKIFFNSDGKLIHSGEFGIYRERISIDLIKSFIPSNLSISDGFIISSDNSVSTQCDIIIYDPVMTPLIKVDHNRFFPIESVKGVIEIKSNLEKSSFKEALIKLSKIKELRKCGLKKEAGDNNNIFTSLICKSVSFKIEDLDKLMNEYVYLDTKNEHRHNVILSINNGILGYNLGNCFDTFNEMNFNYPLEQLKQTFFEFPININVKLENNMISNIENYHHIFVFLNYLKSIGKIRTTEAELSKYLDFKLLEEFKEK